MSAPSFKIQETRRANVAQLKIRLAAGDAIEAESGELRDIEAVACVYTEPEDFDDYGTSWRKGCFDRRAEEHRNGEKPILVLWKHREEFGMTGDIDTDEHLHVVGQPLSDDPQNAVRLSYIEKGIVNAASIGFRHSQSRYEVIEDVRDKWGWPVWQYTDVELREWSPVLWGGVEGAHIVGLREMQSSFDELRWAPPAHLTEQLRTVSQALIESYHRGSQERHTPDSLEMYVLEQVRRNVEAVTRLARGEDIETVLAERADDAHPSEAPEADVGLDTWFEERCERHLRELELLNT